MKLRFSTHHRPATDPELQVRHHGGFLFLPGFESLDS
jgi:hypothetical protein